MSRVSAADSTAPVIAAIDVGTNSFHMVVASVDRKGMMSIHTREKEMVRLGSGGGDMKYLLDDAVQRGVKTLETFEKIARSSDAMVRAVATSAVREALNRDEFLERVWEHTGIDVEVVSGAEEGRLIYVGALHAVPIFELKTLVIDIGGGSTETIIGHRGEVLYVNSEKLGSIRMTKRFFADGNYSREDVKACREYIKGEWAPVMKRLASVGFELAVGTSGTIETIAGMVLASRNQPIPDVLNGYSVEAGDVLDVIKSIAKAETNEKRLALPGMDPSRADIILGGALILERAIMDLGIRKILLSPYALREGIVFDTIQKMDDLREFRHLVHLRYETVSSLCSFYRVDMSHAAHVTRTSLSLFDDLSGVHRLGSWEREMLEAAGMLHDVGYNISHDSHHKHSYYIITHCDMPGFTNDEAEMIANIARYHRKSHPKKKHENFSRLSASKQAVIRVLAGILRIAEGVDRRQLQVAKGARAKTARKGDGDITIIIEKDEKNLLPDIEVWGAVRRKLLLEEALNRKIFVKMV